MLIIRPCVGVRVFPFDAAMSLPQLYLRATPQASRGQTLGVTVTFKRNLPLTIYLPPGPSSPLGCLQNPQQIKIDLFLLWAIAFNSLKM